MTRKPYQTIQKLPTKLIGGKKHILVTCIGCKLPVWTRPPPNVAYIKRYVCQTCHDTVRFTGKPASKSS